MAVAAVDVIADPQKTPVVVLEGVLVQEVDLLGRGAGCLQQGRTRAVSGGAEDVVADGDGGGDVGRAVIDLL